MAGARRSTILRLALSVFVVSIIASACSSNSGGGGQEIVLGLLTDLSGPVKSFGSDIQTAVNLAVSEINGKGGVDGSKLKVVVKDTSLNPDEAVTELRDLVDQDKAVAVLGPVSSGEAEVVFAQAATLKVPVISGTANKEGITEGGKGWAFRDTATNTQLYTQSMPIYQSKFGVTKIDIVYDEKQPGFAGAGQHSIPGVAQGLGIAVTDSIPIDTGQTDFTSVVQRIKGDDVDGIAVASGPVEAGLLATELQRQGVTLPVLGANSQNSAAFHQSGGDAIVNWVLPSVFPPGGSGPKGKTFAEAMAKLDKEPPTVPESANYYDIVYMIAQVAGAAGVDGGTSPADAREAIKKGLSGLKDFEGAAGTTSFLPNGDAEKPVYTLLINGDNTELLQ